jgi:hypothetical protein
MRIIQLYRIVRVPIERQFYQYYSTILSITLWLTMITNLDTLIQRKHISITPFYWDFWLRLREMNVR